MNKILIPLDFSPGSRESIYYVSSFVNKHKLAAQIDLLNVYWVGDHRYMDIIACNDELKNRSKDSLEREKELLIKLLNNKKIKVGSLSTLGNLKNVIFRILETEKYDLIVMAKDEGKKIAELSSLLKHSRNSCPLMTVFPPV
jgi:hypothetical protein